MPRYEQPSLVRINVVGTNLGRHGSGHKRRSHDATTAFLWPPCDRCTGGRAGGTGNDTGDRVAKTNNHTAITFDVLNASSTNWGYFKLPIKDDGGNWCDNGGAFLQPNASGAAAMSLKPTGCGAWNGRLQQFRVYTFGDAYLHNVVAR